MSEQHEYPDPGAAADDYFPWSQQRTVQSLQARTGETISDILEAHGAQAKSGKTGPIRSMLTHQESDSDDEFFDDDGDQDSLSSFSSSLSDDASTSDEPSDASDAGEDEADRFAGNQRKRRRIDRSQSPTPRRRSQRTTAKGIGRAGKGIKRGLRKPVEPGVEFKMRFSKAIVAFTNSDLATAELETLQALQINPEMFQAHSLLSEIHAARGDMEKALSAAWNGAHTKSRDPAVWARIAGMLMASDTAQTEARIRDAIYCYSRIISIDRTDLEARFQRACLNHKLGYRKKAAAEYESMLNHLPHDMTILRHLAEVCLDTGDASQGLIYYDKAIAHFQASEPVDVESFGWSDVNIVLELHEAAHKYEDGIRKLKNLSRWLLGRGEDDHWNSFEDDDREWDTEDDRRLAVPTFRKGEYGLATYGLGLPLEIRIKLGVFRIMSQDSNEAEAKKHFAHLTLDADHEPLNENLYDLFQEVGQAFQRAHMFRDALEYYEPLERKTGPIDIPLYMDIALCYRAVGMKENAEACYKAVLEQDTSNTEAELSLKNLHSSSETRGSLYSGRDAVMNAYARAIGGPLEGRKKADVLTYSIVARSLKPTASTQKKDPPSAALLKQDVQTMYDDWKRLGQDVQAGDVSDSTAMELGRSLLSVFSEERAFFPVDRHHKFYGYSKAARALAARPKYALKNITYISASSILTEDGEEILIPSNFMGIEFSEWLDVFLLTALSAAKGENLSQAYRVLDDAFAANVYYHSEDARFSIQLCRLTCALICNDEESLCNIARWFITEYQFVNDGYRLFAAVNRLCDTSNTWFNSGPSQKFILRQLKAVDFSLLGEERKKGIYQERATYTAKGDDGSPIHATHLDVGLFMLYGYILYAGRSYAYAANYFLRALATDKCNVYIKLSLALSYLHWALKRQAENRHFLVAQGLAFLSEYYDVQQENGTPSERLEAEYNVARSYHLLGLTHLAIPYYERCVAAGTEMREASVSDGEDLSLESALVLQCIWSAACDFEKAYEITRKRLKL